MKKVLIKIRVTIPEGVPTVIRRKNPFVVVSSSAGLLRQDTLSSALSAELLNMMLIGDIDLTNVARTAVTVLRGSEGSQLPDRNSSTLYSSEDPETSASNSLGALYPSYLSSVSLDWDGVTDLGEEVDLSIIELVD